MDLGDIGGIPRLLDVGQCNDAYSAVQIAVALANAFECGVNDLPLSMIQQVIDGLDPLLVVSVEGVTHVATIIGGGAPRFLLTYQPEKPNTAYMQFLVEIENDDLLSAPGGFAGPGQRFLLGQGIDRAGFSGIGAAGKCNLVARVGRQLFEVVGADDVGRRTVGVVFSCRGCHLIACNRWNAAVETAIIPCLAKLDYPTKQLLGDCTMSLLLRAAVCSLLFVSLPAFAKGDAAAGQAKSAVCAACHGVGAAGDGIMANRGWWESRCMLI